MRCLSNSIAHYIAELEVLADVVRQHSELCPEMQARDFAQGQLRRQLESVARAKRDLSEEAARE